MRPPQERSKCPGAVYQGTLGKQSYQKGGTRPQDEVEGHTIWFRSKCCRLKDLKAEIFKNSEKERKIIMNGRGYLDTVLNF